MVNNNNLDSAKPVEIQLAYYVDYSSTEPLLIEDEDDFIDSVADIFVPSNEVVDFPDHPGSIHFYSACCPENFSPDDPMFSFYIHFRVDMKWYMDTDRNNMVAMFRSLKDIAYIKTADKFTLNGNIEIKFESIKLNNITFPYKDEDGLSDEVDSETVE